MIDKKDKTYKDFGVALDKLKEDMGVSFETIGIKAEISPSYLWKITKLRNPTMPKDDIIKRIAKFFYVEPKYFYDWRLKSTLDYIDDNRKFLDVIERAMKKYKVEKTIVEEPKEELAEKKG
mgnify:CR=1 FL=1